MTREEAKELTPNGPATYWLELVICILFGVIFFVPIRHHAAPLWLTLPCLALILFRATHAIQRLFFPCPAAQRSAAFSEKARSALRVAGVVTQFGGLALTFGSRLCDRPLRHDVAMIGWFLYSFLGFFADLAGEKPYRAAPPGPSRRIDWSTAPRLTSDH